jgi:hypothetical protein
LRIFRRYLSLLLLTLSGFHSNFLLRRSSASCSEHNRFQGIYPATTPVNPCATPHHIAARAVVTGAVH